MDSTLVLEAKQAVETLLVEFQDICARQRFVIGSITKFKVQPLPWENWAPYSQSIPRQLTS